MIESIQQIWDIIAPYVTGTTIGSIVMIAVTTIIKSAIAKLGKKQDEVFSSKVVAKEVSNEMKDEIKNISFEQTIQPLVESELKKVIEAANEYIKQQLKETQEGYNKLINCLEKLAAYFDNSIGVSDEAKTELKQAIEEAKVPAEPVNTFETKVVVEEEQPKESVTETKKASKKSAEIER